MPRFFKRLVHAVILGYYWAIDYIYIAHVQLWGLVKKEPADIYLHADPNRHKPPVLLIPGIYERWNFMKPIAERLFDYGYDVHIVENIGYNRGSVEEMAMRVEEYTEAHDLEGCLIVAHSKGGLIGKYLMMADNNQRRYKGMVALNTPFVGSKYAYLFPQKSLRVFTPVSPIVKTLASNESVNARIVSIFGVFDPHIPGEKLLIGARNIQLEVYGHFIPVRSAVVHKVVLEQLRELIECRL